MVAKWLRKFGQFTRAQSPALPALACHYLFDALIMTPRALTFPVSLHRKGCWGRDRNHRRAESSGASPSHHATRPDYPFGTADLRPKTLFYWFKGRIERAIRLAWGRAPVIIVAPGYLN